MVDDELHLLQAAADLGQANPMEDHATDQLGKDDGCVHWDIQLHLACGEQVADEKPAQANLASEHEQHLAMEVCFLDLVAFVSLFVQLPVGILVVFELHVKLELFDSFLFIIACF